MDTTTLHVLLVVFFATLVRSTFGFGEALIAVLLLALTVPIEIAAPLAILLSITIAAVVVVQDWRKIHLRSTGWLLAPTFAGIPLGVWLLTSAHQEIVKAALGIVIVAFSATRSSARVWVQSHLNSIATAVRCFSAAASSPACSAALMA